MLKEGFIVQEKEQLLKETIERTQKIIETQAGALFNDYDKQLNTLLENRTLLDQFKIKRLTREYEYLQFCLNDITPTDLFKVIVKYKGNGIAIITTSKDKAQISTENYDKTNKELFKIDTKLKNEDINSLQVKMFLESFNQDIELKTKINIETQESMLLEEFSKRQSYDKLLTGIQPIKYDDTLYFKIPITINPKQTEYINILCRSRVRKITLVEVLEDGQDLDTILAQATVKAVFLTNLLHTEQGDKWYKFFRISRKITSNTYN